MNTLHTLQYKYYCYTNNYKEIKVEEGGKKGGRERITAL